MLFIDIEFSRLAIGFQKVSIIRLPLYFNSTLIVYVYDIIIIIIIHKSGSLWDLPSRVGFGANISTHIYL